MVAPKKRTPDQAWDALEKMSLDDEVERVLGLSNKQLDGELADAGFDPKGVRERGRAIGEKAESAGAAQRPEASPRAVPLRRARWAAAMAAAVAAAVGLLGGPTLVSHPPRGDTPRERAAVQRAKALDECRAAQWQACLGDLDAAKVLDPTGEDAEAKKWRLAAEAAIHAPDPGR